MSRAYLHLSIVIKHIFRIAIFLFTYFTIPYVLAKQEGEIEDFWGRRCETEDIKFAFEDSVMRACHLERKTCEESIKASTNKPVENSVTVCLEQELLLDSRFVGPCPKYMEEMEKREINSVNDLYHKLRLRFSFEQRGELGEAKITFKRNESYKLTKKLFKMNPDSDVAFDLLFLHELARDNNDVAILNLRLAQYERDPDCPNLIYRLPGSIFVSLYEILGNRKIGAGSGSRLSDVEMKKLMLRSQRAVLSAYEEAIQQNLDSHRSLALSLESIDDPILSGSMEDFVEVGEDVGLSKHEYMKSRASLLTTRFSDSYGTNSKYGRLKSLNMMCNDYAFEIGLMDHCLELIHYYGTRDLYDASALKCDVTQSATMVLNSITRDCSEADDILFWHEHWWNDRRCFEKYREPQIKQLMSLVSRFPVNPKSADESILRAYLSMDEASDEYYLKAVSLDDSMVYHTSRLASRLHRLGRLEAVENILSGVSTDQISLLEETEKSTLENVSKSFIEGSYVNWEEIPRLEFSKDCSIESRAVTRN